MKDITEQALNDHAKMLAQQAEDSGPDQEASKDWSGKQHSELPKDFEHVNKQWKVPTEVLGIMGSVKELQEQLGLGKVALPTIDWGSALGLQHGRWGLRASKNNWHCWALNQMAPCAKQRASQKKAS